MQTPVASELIPTQTSLEIQRPEVKSRFVKLIQQNPNRTLWGTVTRQPDDSTLYALENDGAQLARAYSIQPLQPVDVLAIKEPSYLILEETVVSVEDWPVTLAPDVPVVWLQPDNGQTLLF